MYPTPDRLLPGCRRWPARWRAQGPREGVIRTSYQWIMQDAKEIARAVANMHNYGVHDDLFAVCDECGYWRRAHTDQWWCGHEARIITLGHDPTVDDVARSLGIDLVTRVRGKE